jgi:hypothetical protein
VAVPKAEELVATPYRHGGKEAAETFFLDGMTAALHNLARQAHPAFPVTIYYAFKQSDTKDDGGTHSTGWETFLEAVLRAGFALTGTWPMRTERDAARLASAPTRWPPASCWCAARAMRRPNHQPARVPAPAARAPARGAADHDRRQHRPEPHRPGGPGAGRHRPRHGPLQPVPRAC